MLSEVVYYQRLGEMPRRNPGARGLVKKALSIFFDEATKFLVTCTKRLVFIKSGQGCPSSILWIGLSSGTHFDSASRKNTTDY